MTIDDLTSYERHARQCGHVRIAGVDEAGRGPLAGPVVAAAVILPEATIIRKLMIPNSFLQKNGKSCTMSSSWMPCPIGLGVIEAPVIDAVNIFQATLMAMKEAIQSLQMVPDFLLVDGNHGVRVNLPQKAIVRGDSLSISIAAASIIAQGFQRPDHGDLPSPVPPVQFYQEQRVWNRRTPPGL